MSDLVPAEDIERIVGVKRHRSVHYGRAVSDEQTVYILHSGVCKETRLDLRDCPFSIALDQGINIDVWQRFEDIPVELVIITGGALAPLCPAR